MILLPTVYFGNIEYYRHLISGDRVVIEQWEHFPKQTYRNRAIIMSANGVIPIIVPLSRSRGGKCYTKDIEIDYSMEWQRNAWRAIVSSYRNSAYFDHYEEVIKPIFERRYTTLIEMNSDILNITCGILGVNVDIDYSAEYLLNRELDSDILDLRDNFTPKRESESKFKEYYQVFSDREPFVKNISILDLIFCEGGSYAKDYIGEP